MSYRILMLLENNPYPNDPRVRNEASTLADAGYEVSVICPKADNQPAYEYLNGVHVHRFPAPPEGTGVIGYLSEFGYATVAIFITSLSVLYQRSFDAVHLHNPPDVLVLIALFYKLLGKRIIFDHHDLAAEMYAALFDRPSRLIQRVLLAFEKLSCRVADHVIVTNHSYRTIDIERNGVQPEEITVVRNGPDARFRPVVPDPLLAAGEKIVICYTGEMGRQDGVDYLVRALARLKHDLNRVDFICRVVGRGVAVEDARTLAAQLEVADQIEFTGYVDFREVPRYLSSCDICVAPEPSNAYNNCSTVIKMMEYMAIGKPIVSFDLPEHRFSAGQAAIYAKPNDELDYACQIEYLMDHPEVRSKMSQAGRMRIDAGLGWPHQAKILLSAYEKVFQDLWVAKATPI